MSNSFLLRIKNESLIKELEIEAKENSMSTNKLITHILENYVNEKKFEKVERAFITRLSQHDDLLIENNANIILLLEKVSQFIEKLSVVMDIPIDEVGESIEKS